MLLLKYKKSRVGDSSQSPYFELSDPVYAEILVVESDVPQSSELKAKPIPISECRQVMEGIITLNIEPEFSCGWFSYPTTIICNAILTSILFGYSLSVLNPCMNAISLHFEWCGNTWNSKCPKSQVYQSVINAILFLGAVGGSLISGRLIPLGRRWSLRLACWIFILGGLMGSMAFGSYAWMQLIIARILVGCGLGIVTVVTPLYISEMTPARTRGFFGTMHQTMIGVGIFIGIALGLPLSPNSSNDRYYSIKDFDHWWWRFMLAFQCVPSVFCLIGFTFICTDETPHHLVDTDHTIEAAKTIMHIHGAANFVEIEGTLLEITQAVYEARGLQQITLKEAIKEKYYRYGLLVGFLLACVQQLSGINVIISSSDSLFAMAGLTPDTVTLTSTFMALTNALSSAAAAFFVENWGRRPLLLWGLVGQVIFMEPIGLLRYLNENHSKTLTSCLILSPSESTWLSVVGTIGFVTSFSWALGPIVWIYLSEIYPVEIRGVALGACGAINWVTAFVVVFIGRFLHVTVAFNVFGFIGFGSLICVYLWVIETKGSSIEDSPVSPQSARLSSRLIQNSRGEIQDVTLDDIREKIRSSTCSSVEGQQHKDIWFGCNDSLYSQVNRITGSTLEPMMFDPIRSTVDGVRIDGNISSLGVDPCIMDDTDDDPMASDDTRQNVEKHSPMSIGMNTSVCPIREREQLQQNGLRSVDSGSTSFKKSSTSNIDDPQTSTRKKKQRHRKKSQCTEFGNISCGRS